MFDLFGAEVATPLPASTCESAPVPRGEVLAWEKELLGVWLSEHPFTHAAPHLAPHVTALCNELTPELLGRPAGAGPRLRHRRHRRLHAAPDHARRPRASSPRELEDLSGTLEVTVWPDIYERTQELWMPGSIVLMQVRVRERGDRLTIGVQEVVGLRRGLHPARVGRAERDQ